ncbi:MAG: Gfo/Idh/MocA family oxidoreductase [Treponemataceae bacterium]
MSQIRWGIIGCGDVTEKKSGPGFQKAERSTLTAVMRRDGALAADYAARHGVPRWYDDADQLIGDPEVDAVYIAGPPATHVGYIKKTAAAGKPVYCEKPMGISYAECREAVEFCAARKVPLFVAYYRRGMEKYRSIRDLVQNGGIGKVRHVHVLMQAKLTQGGQSGELPWRLRAEVSGGGLILDVGSHGLDLLDFCLGPIKEAQGFASNQAGAYAVEDTVVGSWIFESGVHGTGNWCFCADKDEDRIVVYGDAGKIAFSVLDAAGPVEVVTEEGTQSLSFATPTHVQQPLIQMVTDDLLGLGKSPSTGESSLRTDRVLDRLRSGYTGAGK